MKVGVLIFFLLAGPAMHAIAEPLGRLFLTPEQRQLLDRQRQQGHGETAESAIRLDGIVTRAGKEATMWINGRARNGAGVDAAATLRVGESIDAYTREKSDVVPHGSIRRSIAH